MALLMEMQRFHGYNTNNSIQTRGSPTDMATEQYILNKTGASTTQHTLAMADAVCGMKERF
jgi:hypothetical protein